MMHGIKVTLAFCLLALINLPTQAQYYSNSMGLRYGHTSAITYKRFFNKVGALELMASGKNRGFQAGAIYQFHKPMPIGFNENFYAYYGIGGHFGYEVRKELVLQQPVNPGSNPDPDFERKDRTQLALGIDPILGFEYRWLAVPITISVDIKPYFQMLGMRFAETRFWDVGVALKYVF